MRIVLMILFSLLIATGITLAKGNNTYFVTVPHTKEECLNAIDDFKGKGNLLSKTEWGCMAGDHTAYLFLQAKSENDAKNMLPEALQNKAKIVQVSKFTVKQIADIHKKMGK